MVGENQSKLNEESAKEPVMMFDSAFFAQIQRNIMQGIRYGNYNFIGGQYTREDILKWLNYPWNYEKELRDLSNQLYNRSQHYKRLILYFAMMPTLTYTLAPITKTAKNKKGSVESAYFRLGGQLEKMNIPHEFRKILIIAFREDAFFGYEWEEESSYYIQKLDPDYCKIDGIEDGVFTFSFDMSYFDNNEDKLIYFHPDFKDMYREYQRRVNNSGLKVDDVKWVKVDPNKSICIKVNEDFPYICPPFAGIIPEIFDLEEFKLSRKIQDKIGKYVLIHQKIPMDEKSDRPNDFKIDKSTAIEFHKILDDITPPEIGTVTSPMPLDAIKLGNPNDDIDNVQKAERDFYGASGVSQFLFNADKSTSVGLDKSIKTDEQIVFAVLRQIERWLNLKIKKLYKTNNHFRVNMLNVTYFNQEETYKKAIELATYGFPTKMLAFASLGYSPTAISDMAFVENDVLDLQNLFVPLQSAHTQSKNDSGRPQKTGDELSPEGLRTRDENKNANRL